MNFALFLLVVTLVTGILWAIDRFWARKLRATEAPEPKWVEYGASFFPVFLAVRIDDSDPSGGRFHSCQ